MTDPMTTTRDGDVLTTQDLVDKVKHLGYALQHGGGGVVLPDLEDIVRSHRALQQRLDAAEQREGRLEDSLRLIRGVAYHDCAEEHIAAKLHNLANAALTEQERDDA